MLNIEKVPVTSSNIEAIGYDKETETLRIWFKAGSVYDYDKVTELVFNGFKTSADARAIGTSVGIYFANQIKGKYEYKKV